MPIPALGALLPYIAGASTAGTLGALTFNPHGFFDPTPSRRFGTHADEYDNSGFSGVTPNTSAMQGYGQPVGKITYGSSIPVNTEVIVEQKPVAVGAKESTSTATPAGVVTNPNYYTHPSNKDYVRLRDSQQQVSTKPAQEIPVTTMSPRAPIVGVEEPVGKEAAEEYYRTHQQPESLAARLAMPDQIGGKAWDDFMRDNRYNSQQVQASPYKTNTSLDSLYGYY